MGVRLVEDGIDADSGLASLTVADDELTLAAADRDHRVDCLHAGLERLGDGLSLDDAGGDDLDSAVRFGCDGSFAIERLAERVHDAAEHALANGDFDDAACLSDGVAFFDQRLVAN